MRRSDSLPGEIRGWVAARVGEPVGFEAAVGGGTPVAGVVRTRDDEFFLKAVRLDSPAVADYRLEALVAPVVPAPRLRLQEEVGGWFVLCFDVAPGHQPVEPWDEPELRGVLSAVDRMAADLQHSLTPGLPTVADRMKGRCSTWRQLHAHGSRDGLSLSAVTEWERSALSRLAAVEADWEGLVRGDSLLHFDLRHDNLRVTPGGEVVMLDWGRACVGPSWVDQMCLLLESSIGDLDADELFLSTRLGAAAAPDEVDAFLVALSSYWRHIAVQPVDEASAWIRVRQQRSGAATIRWLSRRWISR